jgi:hypothetical protein
VPFLGFSSNQKREGGRRPPRCKNHVGFSIEKFEFVSSSSLFVVGSEDFIFVLIFVRNLALSLRFLPENPVGLCSPPEALRPGPVPVGEIALGLASLPQRRRFFSFQTISPTGAPRRRLPIRFSPFLLPSSPADARRRSVLFLTRCGSVPPFGRSVLGFAFLGFLPQARRPGAVRASARVSRRRFRVPALPVAHHNRRFYVLPRSAAVVRIFSSVVPSVLLARRVRAVFPFSHRRSAGVASSRFFSQPSRRPGSVLAESQ